MPGPKKLPLSHLEQLRIILRTGSNHPDYDKAYDIDEALLNTLRRERTRLGFKGMRPARRHYYAIAEINWYVKCDGLSVGVLQNEPEILPVAHRAAEAMKLPRLARVLAAALKCLPPRNMMGSRLAIRRSDWYDGPGQRFAERLEALEERFHEAEPKDGYVGACLRFALQNPAEFFDLNPTRTRRPKA